MHPSVFGSKTSLYDIVDSTPFAKDPMKSLSEEVRKRGLALGFYYSQDQDWHKSNARGNNWDFSIPEEQRDRQQYLNGKVFFTSVNNKYKLITRDKGKTFELYNLIEDKAETVNIIQREPKVAEKMEELLFQWIRAVRESSEGADYD